MKKFIVLGANYSGSGAVVDYLYGRSDVIIPFKKKSELFLLKNPYGILQFYSRVYEAFFPTVASVAMDELEWMLKKVKYKKIGLLCGYNYNQLVSNYIDKVNKYINSITELTYTFKNQWYLIKKNYFQSFLFFYLNKYLYKKNINTQRLPVSKDIFINETKKFLNSLFQEAIEKNPYAEGIVIDQGGSYWCPQKSLLFYDNAKVITVTKDPRDRFVSLKYKKYLKDVNMYVKWFKGTYNFFETYHNNNYFNNIISIKFEDFVLEHDKYKKIVCDFLGLDPSVKSDYKSELSAKNVQKYKRLLTPDEIKVIETQLKDYLHY